VLPDAVLVPDGTVFVSGGGRTGTADVARPPVLQAELYDPVADTWTTLASMHVPRLYHAAAILLPTGEVMTSGTDQFYNKPPFNRTEQRVEVFKPPYLFAGLRPTIDSAPDRISYGETFPVETSGAAIASACLLAPGATTHSFDMSQRDIGLEVQDDGSGSLQLTAPPHGRIAPPGYYMLFVVSTAGVPAIAPFVQLR